MRRFVIICLGLLFLLTACSNTSTGQPTATDHTANSQASTSLGRAKTVEQASPVVLPPHATPAHSKVVTASSSTGSSVSTSASSSASSSTTSGQTKTTETLALALACSGPHAQDGFHVSNSQARACVYTSPGAHLNIKVSFCGNKPDMSGALQGTFTASAAGFYEWDWKPLANCQPLSSWSASVTAQLNGQSAAVSETSSAQGTSQSSAYSSSSSSVNVSGGG